MRSPPGRVASRCQESRRCGLDPKGLLGYPGRLDSRGLTAAYSRLNFSGELRWDICFDTDAGLLVVHALKGPARADLLHERPRVVGQRGLDTLPTGRRCLAEPRAQRVEALGLERRREYRGWKLRPEGLAERVAFLAAEPVGLVENQQTGSALEVERLERFVDDAHVLVHVRVRDIGDVDEKV